MEPPEESFVCALVPRFGTTWGFEMGVSVSSVGSAAGVNGGGRRMRRYLAKPFHLQAELADFTTNA